MPITISADVLNLRDGSIIGKMFNDFKDGKIHKYSEFRAKYVKLGVKKPRQTLFRLDRILRTLTKYQINNSQRTNTVQIVERDKAAAAREAAAKLGYTPYTVAKSVARKALAKSTKSKSKQNKAKSKIVTAKVKSHTTKVAVAVDDDAVLEA